MVHSSTILTASPAGGEMFRELLPWLVVLLITVIVGGVVMYVARRIAHRSDNQQDIGFTLHDLRQLHERGELTDEQFERARAKMIASVRGTADKSDQAESRKQTTENPADTDKPQDEHRSDASDEQ